MSSKIGGSLRVLVSLALTVVTSGVMLGLAVAPATIV